MAWPAADPRPWSRLREDERSWTDRVVGPGSRARVDREWIARANVSAQWHLAASEQALEAARAGCEVRAEVYDRPSLVGRSALAASERALQSAIFDRPVATVRRPAPHTAPPQHPITALRDRPPFSALRGTAPRRVTYAEPPVSPARPPPVHQWVGGSVGG